MGYLIIDQPIRDSFTEADYSNLEIIAQIREFRKASPLLSLLKSTDNAKSEPSEKISSFIELTQIRDGPQKEPTQSGLVVFDCSHHGQYITTQPLFTH